MSPCLLPAPHCIGTHPGREGTSLHIPMGATNSSLLVLINVAVPHATATNPRTGDGRSGNGPLIIATHYKQIFHNFAIILERAWAPVPLAQRSKLRWRFRADPPSSQELSGWPYLAPAPPIPQFRVLWSLPSSFILPVLPSVRDISPPKLQIQKLQLKPSSFPITDSARGSATSSCEFPRHGNCVVVLSLRLYPAFPDVTMAEGAPKVPVVAEAHDVDTYRKTSTPLAREFEADATSFAIQSCQNGYANHSQLQTLLRRCSRVCWPLTRFEPGDLSDYLGHPATPEPLKGGCGEPLQ